MSKNQEDKIKKGDNFFDRRGELAEIFANSSAMEYFLKHPMNLSLTEEEQDAIPVKAYEKISAIIKADKNTTVGDFIKSIMSDKTKTAMKGLEPTSPAVKLYNHIIIMLEPFADQGIKKHVKALRNG